MAASENLNTMETPSLKRLITALAGRLKNAQPAERAVLEPELQVLRAVLDGPVPGGAPGAEQEGRARPSTGELTSQLLQAIFRADPGGLAVVTVDDRVHQMANEAYRSITPHPIIDPVGKCMDEIWTEMDIIHTTQAFQQVMESGQSLTRDYLRTYEDGETRYFTGHLVPLDWNGRPAVLMVVWETSELQRVQQYLVESEERFRMALTHIPDLFVIYDADRRIQFISNAAFLGQGFQTSSFLGLRDEEIWPEAMMAKLMPHLLKAYESKEIQRFDLDSTLPDGRAFSWLVTYVPMLDEHGAIREVMGVAHDITERKQAEDELRRSEGLLRDREAALRLNESELRLSEAMLIERNAALETAQDALINERNRLLAVLEALPVGVNIFDQNGGVTQSNSAFEEVWGGALPLTLGVEDYEAYQAWWPDSGEKVKPEEWASAVAVQKGEAVRDQFLRILRFDGKYGYVLNSAVPIRDVDGNINGGTVAIMDITTQVEAAERFEAMANNIPQLAWMSDPSGALFWYNQRWYDYTGTNFEAMKGWGWQKVHHPDYVEPVTAKFRDHVMRGEAWEDTFPLRGKDGQYRWFLSRAIPIRDAAGNITRWFGTNTDITDRRENEERFRVALAAAPLLVYNCDREQRYTWIYNPLRGFKTEDVLGKRDDEILPADVARELVAAKQRALDTGQGSVQEIRLFMGEQPDYYILTTEPIKDPDGQVTGLTCSAIDITEQRQAEEERRRIAEAQREQQLQVEIQRRLLEYRERERQEIARDLHDGPIQLLAGTIFHLQVAKEATQDAVMKLELNQATLNLKGAVRDLRETVNELRPPALLRFGLTKSAKMHAEDFRERHPEIKLAVNMIDDRGLLSEQACLALFRIYQEALNNVVKHAEASRVWVRLVRKGNCLDLEIRDNGKGVALAGSLAEQTGKGHFGLAGMQERAQAVGGTVTITSVPGKGTRVVAKVPVES